MSYYKALFIISCTLSAAHNPKRANPQRRLKRVIPVIIITSPTGHITPFSTVTNKN